jgi:hypothetical protein
VHDGDHYEKHRDVFHFSITTKTKKKIVAIGFLYGYTLNALELESMCLLKFLSGLIYIQEHRQTANYLFHADKLQEDAIFGTI